jgi:hypothetical protein
VTMKMGCTFRERRETLSLRYGLIEFAAGALGLAIVTASSLCAIAQSPPDPAAIVQSQQNQSATLAATWLASSDARTRAWGAYLALRDRREELLPKLIGLAEGYPVKSGPLHPAQQEPLLWQGAMFSDHTATLGVLDAIIQMDGKVPPKEAARLYPEFPVQALILLANGGPEASSFLLDIFQENSQNSHPLVWLAAGNLLMKLKPAGFAAAVLGGLTVNASVHVIDKGGPNPAGGKLGSCSWTPPSHWPSDWPPIASYSLNSPFEARGTIMLADGITPSFYTRAVGETAPYTDVPPCESHDRDVEREHFLASLVYEPPGNPTVQSLLETTITWENNEQYLLDLRAFIDREQGLFDKLSSKLVALGLLSSEESAFARPALRVLISDDRSRKAASLPVIQSIGPNVSLVN